MYYLLLYEVVDGFIERRTPYRDHHLRLANQAHERCELVLAGALAEPADGAVFGFKTEHRSEIEQFAQSDPYVIEGLVKQWRVRKWNVVVGGDR